jgi:hypothetical protein
VRPIGAPNEAPRGSHIVLEGWVRSAKLGAIACAVHQRRLAGPPKTGWASPPSWRRNRRGFGKKAVPVCARSAEGPRPCEPQGPVTPRATAVRGSRFCGCFIAIQRSPRKRGPCNPISTCIAALPTIKALRLSSLPVTEKPHAEGPVGKERQGRVDQSHLSAGTSRRKARQQARPAPRQVCGRLRSRTP